MFENDLYTSSIRPPLAGWIGGKSLLAKRIIERIPEHTCYVEPFAGAAWVFFRKRESKVEVLNDINREIVTLYRCIQWHREELVRYFKWALVSREDFLRFRKADPETLTDIQRAARFYYLQQSSFGGTINPPRFGFTPRLPSRLNLPCIEKYMAAAHLRLCRSYIECLPFDKVIRRYDRPDTFFYVDPPYWGAEDHYGKGVFNREDYGILAALLAGIKGKFLLSLNDTPEVREAFAGFAVEEIRTHYSCGKDNYSARELLFSK
jgi:DNA adenine methylase